MRGCGWLMIGPRTAITKKKKKNKRHVTVVVTGPVFLWMLLCDHQVHQKKV